MFNFKNVSIANDLSFPAIEENFNAPNKQRLVKFSARRIERTIGGNADVATVSS
jgi:hypothetical protein